MGLLISEVEQGPCYAMSVPTLMHKYGVSQTYIAMVSADRGWNLFRYQGVTYVGTKEMHRAYYHDKLLGQNPFYQTY